MFSQPVFSREFFLREPLLVARDLLGAELITINKQGTTSGMIVEAEAYPADDEASHSFRGITKRNNVMFSEGGHCYVYLCYGVHNCVNVVTEAAGTGSAILIRALVPLTGIDLMKQRRGVENINNLTSGPGKLCQALSIKAAHNGEDFLSSSNIMLRAGNRIDDSRIRSSARIGISKAVELPYRLFIEDPSSFVAA